MDKAQIKEQLIKIGLPKHLWKIADKIVERMYAYRLPPKKIFKTATNGVSIVAHGCESRYVDIELFTDGDIVLAYSNKKGGYLTWETTLDEIDVAIVKSKDLLFATT